jgi:hypothetical protein
VQTAVSHGRVPSSSAIASASSRLPGSPRRFQPGR